MLRIALRILLLSLFFGHTLKAQTPQVSVRLAFKPAKDEFFTQSFLHSEKLLLFTTTIDTKDKTTLLKAYGFDAKQGDCLWSKSIDSAKVGKWLSKANKGNVWQDFSNALASNLSGSSVLPLEYQYRVSYSPDHSKIVAYFYDYSQPTLSVRVSLFDSTLHILRNESIPIDNESVNYGLMVGNQGQIFILNSGLGGSIQLIEYNSLLGQTNLLEVSANGSSSRSLRLFLTDDEAWVASTIEGRQGLLGVNVVRFNLKYKAAEQAQFLPLPESISKQLAKGSGLQHVLLEDFWVNSRKEASFLLQQKNILASGYKYNSSAVNNPLLWQSRKAMVAMQSLTLLSYDTLGVLLDEKVVAPTMQKRAAEAYEQTGLIVNQHPTGSLGLTDISATTYLEVVDSKTKLMILEKSGQSYTLKTYR